MENLTGYQKLEAFQKQGIDAYPHQFDISHNSGQIQTQFSEVSHEGSTETVKFAGRIMTMRSMGKITFAHLQDTYGKIQVYAGKNDLGEEKFKLFNEFDMGDIIGVSGPVFKTKTGEITVRVMEFQLLSKSLRNLPEKWHGLKDVELRYRQRYLDLISNPEVKDIFIKRSKIISAMREYLDSHGYLEIETPMMQPLAGGATARPFKTHHNALGIPLYLRVAPELYHKRLVVGGLEKIYEINRNFRNEGVSTKHNPEFTMMELYTSYWDYNKTMDLCEDMIRFICQKALGTTTVEYQGTTLDFGKKWTRFTVLESIEHYTKTSFQWGEDFTSAKEKAAKLCGVPSEFKTADEIIMFVFEECVEKNLVQPTIIKDYPSSLSPLSKASDAHPEIAERFEPYVAGMEIGNAYSEQNDPVLQRKAFEDQVKQSDKNEELPKEIDEDYLRALEHGMPPASGLGIGIDRLTMILTNQSSIREVILFPLLRPEA
jgi:lysyl-tRNA synthetase, class II